jgi:hypothetical protein
MMNAGDRQRCVQPEDARAECEKSDAAAAAGISVKGEGFVKVVPGYGRRRSPMELSEMHPPPPRLTFRILLVLWLFLPDRREVNR